MESDSAMQLEAVLIGDKADEFIKGIQDLLIKYGIIFTGYENVYSAVGSLAKSQGNKLVIGRIEELSVEGKRFFEKLNAMGNFCCCLVDVNCVRKYLQSIAVIGAQAVVINEPFEIKEVLDNVITGSLALQKHKKNGKKTSDFMKDEFVTTREEIKALLDNNEAG